MKRNSFLSNITVGKVFVVITVIFFITLFIYAGTHKTTNLSTDNIAWNEGMTLGDKGVENTLIDYTDYFCPYCIEIKEATESNEFKKNYIDTKKVRLENRVTTILSGVSANTEQGAEAAYCAADQNKYWEYSKDIISHIKTDYFDKGIGVKDVAFPKKIDKLPIDYFTKSAITVGMDTKKFEDCVSSEVHKNEIESNTQKAISLGVNGLPYLSINNYKSSGFSGGYSGLINILKAGGVK